jgi:hypothetical protein
MSPLTIKHQCNKVLCLNYRAINNFELEEGNDKDNVKLFANTYNPRPNIVEEKKIKKNLKGNKRHKMLQQEKKTIKNIKKIFDKGMEDCNAPNNQILVLQTPPSPKRGHHNEDDEEINL